MKPLVIAHRGYHKVYFENTLKAFIEASKRNVYGIETDVHRTIDGKWIVHHNDEIISGGRPYTIATSTYEELKNLHLDNDQNDGDAKICLLVEYLKVCKDSGKRPIIEIKNSPKWKYLKELVNLIDSYMGINNVTLIAFYPWPLIKIRLSFKNRPCLQQLIEKHLELASWARKLHADIDIEDFRLTDEMVKQMHDKGLKVNVWTVNTKEQLENALSRNVDYITTDEFSNDDF